MSVFLLFPMSVSANLTQLVNIESLDNKFKIQSATLRLNGKEIVGKELGNITNNIIRAGDVSKKMVPIYGGEAGRELLIKLNQLPGDTDVEIKVASLLQRILIDRWYQIATK